MPRGCSSGSPLFWGASCPMERTLPICFGAALPTWTRFSKAPRPAICQSSCRRISSWSSTSRPRGPRSDDSADGAGARGSGDRIANIQPRRPVPPPDVESGRRRVVRVCPLPGGMRHREHASARPGLCAVGEVQRAVRSARSGRSRRPDQVRALEYGGRASGSAMPRRGWPHGAAASRGRGRPPSQWAMSLRVRRHG